MNAREVSKRLKGVMQGLISSVLGVGLAVGMFLATPASSADGACNPALWKIQVKDDYAALLEDVKSGLEAQGFNIVSESNLAGALATNREVLGMDKWNTIGFNEARAVQFCSLLFNQEVLNLNMDYSVLCPFKVVLYTMKANPDMVTILMVRPTYLLAHYDDPSASAVGKKIEDRIIEAVMNAMPPHP